MLTMHRFGDFVVLVPRMLGSSCRREAIPSIPEIPRILHKPYRLILSSARRHGELFRGKTSLRCEYCTKKIGSFYRVSTTAAARKLFSQTRYSPSFSTYASILLLGTHVTCNRLRHKRRPCKELIINRPWSLHKRVRWPTCDLCRGAIRDLIFFGSVSHEYDTHSRTRQP